MNYYLFLALLFAAAAGLAHVAASLLLRGRARDITSVMLIVGIASVGTFVGTTSNAPRVLYLRLFSEPDLAVEVEAMIAADNLDWLFENEADRTRFIEQAARAAGSRARLEATAAALIAERTKAQMRFLGDADIKTVIGVIDGALATMVYFLENKQFGNCRTFLMGGYDYPGADPSVITALLAPVRAAVESGRRGEKNWTALGAEEMAAYNLKTVDHLRAIGYGDQQLAGLSRLDTTDPAQMETNCRVSHEFFRHMRAEYPPEAAATLYVSAL
jgi:hypothetical protein